MALGDVFLRPLGLLGLAALVPLLLLYLLEPEPERVVLPTARFLAADDEEERHHPALAALRRNRLLLLQVLVLALVSLALASPYVLAGGGEVGEAVLVVDASASMATAAGGETRFDRAIAAARARTGGTTTVVAAGASPTVALEGGSSEDAAATLDSLSATGAPGDLAAAVSRAVGLAGEGARIVVVSDFAGGSDWRSAVDLARARGHPVELVQVGGPADNVGIVDLAFSGEGVTVSVRNFGDARAERTLRLGEQSRSLSLAPGDAASARFDVPAGGGRVELRPGDALPADDTAPVVAPRDPTIDVLVFTNDRNQFLTTALSLVGAVELTVKRPPTAIEGRYDVIVFSNVAPDRLLPGNVRTARETLRRGGGVAIQAQPDAGAAGYGDLLLVEPDGLGSSPSLAPAGEASLTEGISFAPPGRYLRGDLRSGRALLETAGGTPLLATDTRGRGRILYYGLIENASGFKYNYMYPVFWKRAAFHLTGRPSPAELNRRTGERWTLGNATTVEGPGGSVRASSVRLDAVGVYAAGDRRVGAALRDPGESNVTAPRIKPPNASRGPGETGRSPRDLGPLAALAAVGLALVELAVLRRRGDL